MRKLHRENLQRPLQIEESVRIGFDTRPKAESYFLSWPARPASIRCGRNNWASAWSRLAAVSTEDSP
jgi:hypothetical protein